MASGKQLTAVKATVLDDDHFRLLALPFDGPIPSPMNPRGVDLDGQWFSPNTDPKRDWFPFRLVDWHHRDDKTMAGTILGKAVMDDEPDEDGWWVDVWLRHGERRLDLVRRLAERGGQLFGSSESHPQLAKVRTAKGEVLPWAMAAHIPGELVEWPYIRQTLSTSPQNTYSVLRPLKASLDDLTAEGAGPSASFFDDLAGYLDNLAAPPDSDLTGELSAKAGRVLAARNEARLRGGMQLLDERGWDPTARKHAIAEFAAVLAELEQSLDIPVG